MASALEAPAARVIGRESELARIRDFIERIGTGPVSLLLHGAVGIGKTTLWRAGLDAAVERSYRVLSCRPAEVESRLAFGAGGSTWYGNVKSVQQLAKDAFDAINNQVAFST
jgi:DNA replication protein DnaC